MDRWLLCVGFFCISICIPQRLPDPAGVSLRGVVYVLCAECRLNGRMRLLWRFGLELFLVSGTQGPQCLNAAHIMTPYSSVWYCQPYYRLRGHATTAPRPTHSTIGLSRNPHNLPQQQTRRDVISSRLGVPPYARVRKTSQSNSAAFRIVWVHEMWLQPSAGRFHGPRSS